MATFNATFAGIQNTSARGAEHAIPVGKGAVGVTALTTSGTAQTVQRGGSNWTAPADGFFVVFCDGAVRVAVAETAATGATPVGHYVAASIYYTVSIQAGQTVSVIDA